MSTSENCIAKEVRNCPGNQLHRLSVCEDKSSDKAIRTVKGDITTTEFLYAFEDGSTLRVIQTEHNYLRFIASARAKEWK